MRSSLDDCSRGMEQDLVRSGSLRERSRREFELALLIHSGKGREWWREKNCLLCCPCQRQQPSRSDRRNPTHQTRSPNALAVSDVPLLLRVVAADERITGYGWTRENPIWHQVLDCGGRSLPDALESIPSKTAVKAAGSASAMMFRASHRQPSL